METKQIRLTKEQVKWLGKEVKKGRFPNVSEGVRFAVARMIEDYDKNQKRGIFG